MQINEVQLKMKMEELGIDPDTINQLMAFLMEVPQPPSPTAAALLLQKKAEIRLKIAKETNWRKKAALYAELIGLDY